MPRARQTNIKIVEKGLLKRAGVQRIERQRWCRNYLGGRVVKKAGGGGPPRGVGFKKASRLLQKGRAGGSPGGGILNACVKRARPS